MMKQKFNIFSYWAIVILFAVIKLVIHMLVAGNYELHRDALLYIAQSDHLDWGYWSVPPMTAFLTRIFREIFGNSFYAIRLLPALIGVVTIFIIGDAVRILGGKKPAFIMAVFAFLFSVAYLRSNCLLQPVSIDQLFWFLAFYVTLKLISTQNTKYWILLAVILGLGFLNKYLIVFLALGLFVSILLTSQRKLLWSRDVIYAVIAGLLVVSPNLWWQYKHHWVVLYHMELLRKYQLVNVSFSGFFIGVILMNISSIAVWISGWLYLLFGKDFKSYRSVGFSIIAVIFLIAWLQGKPYYTLGLYTILFVFGGVAYEKYIWNKRKWIYFPVLFLIPFILLPALPLALPVLKFDRLKIYCDGMKKAGLDAPLRWEDARAHDIPQDYADMTGWKELSDIVAKTYFSLTGDQRKNAIIYAENYGQAGAIHYYGSKKRLPEPVSFHESFIFWAPDSLKGAEYLIYVNDDTTDIVKYFKSIVKTGEVQDPYFREGRLPVWLCSDPFDPELKFYTKIARPLKQRFIRGYP
jgi:hypothetical protein